MTRLPSMKASDVIKRLKKAGFVFDRYEKGSHEIWYNPETKRRVTPKGTLSAIIKEAGYSIEDFLRL